MLHFQPKDPSDEERARLESQQAIIDGLPSYEQRVRAAKKWNAAALGSARTKLHHARPGRDRCVFCEDSEGRDTEHLLPRALFPEATWRWDNLLQSCGGCNGPKGARHAILTPTGAWQEVTRKRKAPVVPPPTGPSAWIDPRAEDPMGLLELDILGDSFHLLPRDNLEAPDVARIDWTVEECLGLNERESLVQARRTAFSNYRARLREYVQKMQDGADASSLHRLRDDLRGENHPTVWAEMKRQRKDLGELAMLFEAAPEALEW